MNTARKVLCDEEWIAWSLAKLTGPGLVWMPFTRLRYKREHLITANDRLNRALLVGR